MSIKRFFPDTRPTLDLNFAATKRLDPRITYTRASTGTFVGSNGLIQSAAVNQARFEHNPLTGESLGLLVEEARTNALIYSRMVSDTGASDLPTGFNGWNPAVFLRVASLAPDGTTNISLHGARNNNGGGLRQTITGLVANGTYAISWYARTVTSAELAAFTAFHGATTGTSNGATNQPYYAGVSTSCSALIFNSQLTSSWKRFSGTAVADGAGSLSAIFGGGTSPAREGSVIAMWGAQLEAGSFPTSYIPTTGATVTRAGEAVSITGANFTNFFNTSAGTFLCEWKSASPSNERILNFGTGSAATVISNEGVMGSGVYFSPLQVFPSSISTNNIKVITATSVGESAGAYNENTAVSTGACSYYASATSLDFSPASNGTRVNWYKKVTYWPARLSNGQLQALTAT
jgi:hypothetical protein